MDYRSWTTDNKPATASYRTSETECRIPRPKISEFLIKGMAFEDLPDSFPTAWINS
jgi:hypothetical protein